TRLVGRLDSQFCAVKGEEQRGKREGQGASTNSVSARRQKAEPDWRYTRDARATLSYPKMSSTSIRRGSYQDCSVRRIVFSQCDASSPCWSWASFSSAWATSDLCALPSLRSCRWRRRFSS